MIVNFYGYLRQGRPFFYTSCWILKLVHNNIICMYVYQIDKIAVEVA